MFGTVAVTEEWPQANLGNVKPKLLRTGECGLTSLNPECKRKCATVAERNWQLHIACATVGKDGSPVTLHNVTKPLRKPQHQPQRLQHPRQKKN